MALSIQPLKSLPEHIPLVAMWCSTTWGHLSGLSAADYESWLHKRLSPDEFGDFWVALWDGKPVGCVQLTTWHITEKKNPIPALANLYVEPQNRKQHIGRHLCNHVEISAKAEYLDVLYLIADDGIEDYYQNLGWEKNGVDGDKSIFIKHLA
ncbi:MAG: GNAT family N-acetyltransferase [Alphaproteobacteria bacterium]|nr:GNAT family N-acetyltransferase [Alphaproteobacteria bacterium]